MRKGKVNGRRPCKKKLILIPALAALVAAQCQFASVSAPAAEGEEAAQEDACPAGGEHEWGDWVVTVEPTDTEDGTEQRVCAKCGETQEEAIHDWEWEGYERVTEPTCTEDGLESRVCKRCGVVEEKTIPATGHSYEYQPLESTPATRTEDGWSVYRCSVCGDTYEVTQPSGGGEDDSDGQTTGYQSITDAHNQSLTLYVGYFGTQTDDYAKKAEFSLEDIADNWDMVTQTYSYIDKAPYVAYDVARGPLFSDVLSNAGIDAEKINSFSFHTYDSGTSTYGEDYNYSTIFATRWLYPKLSLYFTGIDGDLFSDTEEAQANPSKVKPMLAIWDSWQRYSPKTEFDPANHSYMQTGYHTFRLLYGQEYYNEIGAFDSAYGIDTIYVQYEGSPTLETEDDLTLSIGEDRTLEATIRADDPDLEQSLNEKYGDTIVWRFLSGDEGVVDIDGSGHVKVKGEGMVTLRAQFDYAGSSGSVYKDLTIRVSGDPNDPENPSGGGGGGDDSGGGGGDSGTGGGGGDSGTGGGGGDPGTGGSEDSGTGGDTGGGTGEDQPGTPSPNGVSPVSSLGNPLYATTPGNPGSGAGAGSGSGSGAGSGTGAGSGDGSGSGGGWEVGSGPGGGSVGQSSGGGQGGGSAPGGGADGGGSAAAGRSDGQSGEGLGGNVVVSPDKRPSSIARGEVEVSSRDADTADSPSADPAADEDAAEPGDGLTLRAASLGGGGGGSGEDSDEESSPIELTLENEVVPYLITIFALAFFALGCVGMFIRYKREI